MQGPHSFNLARVVSSLVSASPPSLMSNSSNLPSESDMTERLSLRKKLQRVEMVEKSDGNYLVTEVDFLVKCEHPFTVLCLYM